MLILYIENSDASAQPGKMTFNTVVSTHQFNFQHQMKGSSIVVIDFEIANSARAQPGNISFKIKLFNASSNSFPTLS